MQCVLKTPGVIINNFVTRTVNSLFMRAVFGEKKTRKSAMDSSTAQASFEAANSVRSVASVDAIFRYDHSRQQELLAAKLWEKE